MTVIVSVLQISYYLYDLHLKGILKVYINSNMDSIPYLDFKLPGKQSKVIPAVPCSIHEQITSE